MADLVRARVELQALRIGGRSRDALVEDRRALTLAPDLIEHDPVEAGPQVVQLCVEKPDCPLREISPEREVPDHRRVQLGVGPRSVCSGLGRVDHVGDTRRLHLDPRLGVSRRNRQRPAGSSRRQRAGVVRRERCGHGVLPVLLEQDRAEEARDVLADVGCARRAGRCEVLECRRSRRGWERDSRDRDLHPRRSGRPRVRPESGDRHERRRDGHRHSVHSHRAEVVDRRAGHRVVVGTDSHRRPRTVDVDSQLDLEGCPAAAIATSDPPFDQRERNLRQRVDAKAAERRDIEVAGLGWLVDRRCKCDCQGCGGLLVHHSRAAILCGWRDLDGDASLPILGFKLAFGQSCGRIDVDHSPLPSRCSKWREAADSRSLNRSVSGSPPFQLRSPARPPDRSIGTPLVGRSQMPFSARCAVYEFVAQSH